MANPTNNSVNTASPTNNPITGSDLTWDEATFTWDASDPSTWDAQYFVPVTNRSINTASVTNNSTDT